MFRLASGTARQHRAARTTAYKRPSRAGTSWMLMIDQLEGEHSLCAISSLYHHGEYLIIRLFEADSSYFLIPLFPTVRPLWTIHGSSDDGV